MRVSNEDAARIPALRYKYLLVNGKWFQKLVRERR
jgi:hypothetical protein